MLGGQRAGHDGIEQHVLSHNVDAVQAAFLNEQLLKQDGDMEDFQRGAMKAGVKVPHVIKANYRWSRYPLVVQWRKAGRGSRAGHEGAEERVLSRDIYAVKSVLAN